MDSRGDLGLAVLVISGSGRGSGKTAVGCALISAMPEFRWAAAKVTPHRHEAPVEIWEEHDSRSGKDTGRFLAAGAKRAFLISSEDEQSTTKLLHEVRALAFECDALLVETNRIDKSELASAGERAVSLAVIGNPGQDLKSSLVRAAMLADAIIQASDGDPLALPFDVSDKKIFLLNEGKWTSSEIEEFVRSLLSSPS